MRTGVDGTVSCRGTFGLEEHAAPTSVPRQQPFAGNLRRLAGLTKDTLEPAHSTCARSYPTACSITGQNRPAARHVPARPSVRMGTVDDLSNRFGYRPASGTDTVRANRHWWDDEARDYLAEHGDFLGDDGFVWCPEGLDEDDAQLVGDVAGRDVLEIGCGAAQCSRWVARPRRTRRRCRPLRRDARHRP